MATLDPLDAPLYSIAECTAKIEELNKNIRAIGRRPVRASSKNTGSADYTGRLKELREERAYWNGMLREAREWERAKRGSCRSRFNGPRQRME